MSSTRRFTADDLFKVNPVNLDRLTETYNIFFYFQYMSQWPDYQRIMENPDGSVMAYIIGKAEGYDTLWHGHVSAVTVGPEYRRLGHASKLMDFLEEVSVNLNCYFVDLFVRVSNKLAIDMYKHFGYTVYRTIIGYYSGEEDAYDMRKALPRDVHKASVVPLTKPVHPSEINITM